MWIAERTRGEEKRASAESAVVTIGGDAAAVVSRGEERGLSTASPGGYAWRPRSGEQVLTVRGGTQEAERWIVGVLGASEQASLADGEVCLFSAGGARICLRNDGRVEITGTVYVNGVPLSAQTENDEEEM